MCSFRRATRWRATAMITKVPGRSWDLSIRKEAADQATRRGVLGTTYDILTLRTSRLTADSCFERAAKLAVSVLGFCFRVNEATVTVSKFMGFTRKWLRTTNAHRTCNAIGWQSVDVRDARC